MRQGNKYVKEKKRLKENYFNVEPKKKIESQHFR